MNDWQAEPELPPVLPRHPRPAALGPVPAGVVRKYSSKTSVIARIPMEIDESSATKFRA
jgi:hypothetical protein